MNKYLIIFYAILGFSLVMMGIYLASDNLISGMSASAVGMALINLSLFFASKRKGGVTKSE